MLASNPVPNMNHNSPDLGIQIQLSLMSFRSRGIQSKIADLNKLALILDNMTSQCSKGQMPECPIIDTLSVDG